MKGHIVHDGKQPTRLRAATAATMAILGLSCQAATAEDESKEKVLDTIIVYGVHEDDGYAPLVASVATKAPADLIDTPQSITVITRQQIEDRNFFTVGEALQQVTSVTVMPFDGTNTDYRARGFVRDLAYDGIPAAYSSGIQEFDLSIYERIEVLRGPSGLFRGAGSPGGLVNYVRKRGLDEFEISGALSAGTWNNYRAEFDVGGPLDKAGRLRSRVVASHQDRDHFAEGTSNRKSVGYGALDFDLTPTTTIGASFTYQDNETHNPYTGQPAYDDGSFLDFSRDFSATPDWNLFTFESSEVAAELKQRLGRWTIQLRAMSQDQDKFYTDAFISPRTGVDADTLTAQYNRRRGDLDYDKRGVDAYASGPFRLFGREQWLTLGYTKEWRDSEFFFLNASQVAGVSILDPDVIEPPTGPYASGSVSELEQDGFYGQVRLSPVDRLTVLLGARVGDYLRTSRRIAPSTPTDPRILMEEKGEITPNAGVVYNLTGNLNAYASYAEIFVPQSARQANGDTLDPRIGEQWEAGLKGRFFDGGLTATAAVFRSRDRNRALRDPANPGFFLPAGLVRIEGFEIEVTGSPLAGLDLNVGYSNVKTFYEVSALPEGTVFDNNEPRHLFKAYARYEPASLGGAFGAVGVTAQSSVLGAGVEGLREQDGYALANLQVGYRFDDNLRAFLSVNNLFDKTYYARVGPINTYNYFGEPRNVMLTIRSRY